MLRGAQPRIDTVSGLQPTRHGMPATCQGNWELGCQGICSGKGKGSRASGAMDGLHSSWHARHQSDFRVGEGVQARQEQWRNQWATHMAFQQRAPLPLGSHLP